MRFRSLRVDWGATYVLERALERLRKQLYLDQMILLALRVLACLAIVFAFARPVSNASTSVASGTGIHRIVLLDASQSMHANAGEQSLWDQQLTVLRQLIGTWGRGERWSLLIARESPQWILRDATIDTPAAAIAHLDTLAPAETRADLGRALTELINTVGTNPVELYIFSDDQATSWPAATSLPPLPPSVTVYWLRGQPASRQNLAVTSLTPGWERPLVGHPLPVRVTIRNYGTQPIRDTSLDLLIDGTFQQRRTLSLLAGQETTITLQLTPQDPGPRAITARLADDALPADNAFSAGLQVVEAFHITVIRAPNADDKFASAYDFLHLASQVMTRTRHDAPLWREALVHVSVSPPDAPLADLTAVDAILIDSGSGTSPELADRLQAALAEGVGIIFAPDERTNPAQWNTAFGPLLPAPLANAQSRPLGGDDAIGVPDTTLHFYSWMALAPPPEETQILATYTTGDPWILGRRTAGGRTILVTSGLNGRTNNLIVNESFYPWWLRICAEAATGRIHPRTLPPREPLRMRLHEPATVRAVTFNLEAETPVPLPTQPTTELTAGAPHSGLASILVIREGTTTRTWFGIQAQRPDSDLRPWSDTHIATFTERWNVQTAATWQELDEHLQQARRGHEWQAWVLIALLIFLLGEMLMEHRFI